MAEVHETGPDLPESYIRETARRLDLLVGVMSVSAHTVSGWPEEHDEDGERFMRYGVRHEIRHEEDDGRPESASYTLQFDSSGQVTNASDLYLKGGGRGFNIECNPLPRAQSTNAQTYRPFTDIDALYSQLQYRFERDEVMRVEKIATDLLRLLGVTVRRNR